MLNLIDKLKFKVLYRVRILIYKFINSVDQKINYLMSQNSLFGSLIFCLIISIVSSSAAIFLTHGGGPYPILEPSLHVEMFIELNKISQRFPSPRAILFISSHWEEQSWTMIDHDQPALYYDYYGFPSQAYNLSYKLKSTSQLRSEIRNSLKKNGIHLKSNFGRGYDHGVFIPMMIMYQNKKTPSVIELSIKRNLNPQEHFHFGKTLRELKNQGFLIICSGASSHGGFGQLSSLKKSEQFTKYLSSIFMNQFNEQKILSGIRNWKKLPHSNQMHPREEHLLPLFVALGAYEGKQIIEQKYVDQFMKLNLRNYIFY